MLVINVEKFASTPSALKRGLPIAIVKLEILEGNDMKPSDINGLADPYVKGRLGPFKFQTQIQRKTLSPKWFEEFKIPITSWEASNELAIQVRDKDPMFDDLLGYVVFFVLVLLNLECTIDVQELRGGQRHDKWLSLKNIKKGRIHLAITVEDIAENSKKGSSKDLDPNLPTTPGSQSARELDLKLPQTPRPNLKELGERRTSIKVVVSEDPSPAGKMQDAENSTEDVAKVIEKNTGEPGRSLTGTLSRMVSRKKMEDKLSDIPEQVEAHEPGLVSEGQGPIPAEGKPLDGHPTTELGSEESATEETVEAKTNT
ncbi:hypothetical protein PR202_ga24337 [Eleusine coracana subsp. coracana]|uniref:C2 domain-containing protein n=1 Tax=Eleusine coracana subsp. coracana TaxID=191504 RepID=A0AAV5D8L7_ELECO|nr:hypothetical protein PR202_ga24337 [Eleusine coracana subsp. coracana]